MGESAHLSLFAGKAVALEQSRRGVLRESQSSFRTGPAPSQKPAAVDRETDGARE